MRGKRKGAAGAHADARAQDHRTFGLPSVRADVPRPALKSVADHMNYGDDPTVRDLLFPTRSAAQGVGDDEFVRSRNKEEVRDVFEAIGYRWVGERVRCVHVGI